MNLPVLVNFLKHHHLWRSLTFYVIIEVWVIFRCYAYSSTDNSLSQFLVSDWLIFCWEIWYFIRKRNENVDFLIKNQQQNATKVYVNIKQHFLLWTYPTEPWCNMLQTLEMLSKYRWNRGVPWGGWGGEGGGVVGCRRPPRFA